VPSGAIRPSGGRTGVVYTITAGRQVARHVTTGLAAGGLTQITSGLTAGERVVVDIPRAVKAGQSGGGPGSNTVFVGPNGGVVQFRGRPGVGPGGG
jgi:multidrug efflux pump subunit AcrA (membrane-fusion protein)